MNVIQILEDLIAIDSANPFKMEKPDPNDPGTWMFDGNETKISDYLEEKLRQSGFGVKRQPVHTGTGGQKFHNLIAEKGSGNSSILFYGHMDTASAAPWLSRKDALTPKRLTKEIEGKEREIILGLGANDMKAGLAIMSTAFKDINPKNFKIKVVFGVDEEFYSLGSNILAKSDFMNDVRAIIVSEIGDGPNQCFGASTITLGRLGRCEFVIKVPGTSGHGAVSTSPYFVNAAVECMKIINRIEEARKAYRDEFKFFEGNVPDKNAKSLIAGSFFVSKVEAGEGTLSVPVQGKIIIDYTFTPNNTIEDGYNLIQEIIENMYKTGELKEITVSGKTKKVRVDKRLRPTPSSGAFITNEGHPFTRFVKDLIDRKIGFENYNMGYSVADENVFARVRKHLPILCIAPIGEDCHKADEWVDIESVIEIKHVFSAISEEFAKYLKKTQNGFNDK